MNRTPNGAYDQLVSKLEEFIRKYYKNQMIRGTIYSVALLVGSYLVVVLLESAGRFNTGVRTVLFWLFIVSAGYILFRFILTPLLRLMRLGGVISHEQAAGIIGDHFPNVRDKLLNTLQLKDLADRDGANDLLIASVNQRIDSLRPVPFSSAIDLKQNKKYLKYAIPPVAILLFILFTDATILTKPTDRLIRHGQIIAEEAPFQISLINEELVVVEGESFVVEIELRGKEIPATIYAEYLGQQFLLEQKDPLHFSYTFRNIQEDLPFNFYAAGFHSDQYLLEVLPAPRLVDFSARLNYPAYIRRAGETVSNAGDLTVPEGTSITWDFTTQNSESLDLIFSDSTYRLTSGRDNYTFTTRAMTNGSYTIVPSNARVVSRDSLSYRLQVIPDQSPFISCDEQRDSASYAEVYFTGEIRDDYGFRSLTFNYYRISDQGSEELPVKVNLPFSREFNNDVFFYTWDLRSIGLTPGDRFGYYFEVSDNDGVNGSKSARTSVREYSIPSETELEKNLEEQNEDIKTKLEDSVKDAQKLQKELEELQRQMLDKQQLNWQDKKKLEDLLKKQQELQNQVKEIQDQNSRKNQTQNEFQQQNENILEKQKQLEELMEQVMSPELQQMMEELQRLMEELDKDKLQDELDQLNLNNEDLEKELDRALEQFRQLEWEQKMEKTIEKLKELAEKQDKLGDESEKKNADPEQLAKEQEELKKEFEQVKEDMDKLEQLNEELENPNEIPDTENQEKEIQEEQQKSSDELKKNKKSSASKAQKNAGQKMKQMAQQMEMAMDSAEQEQQEEDMEALRALLENIITLSFDQESLMAEFKAVDMKDPKFNSLGQAQRKLKDDARMVEDSLFALSKRVPQISAAVNHEINLVNENMTTALESVPDRKIPEITTAQQYVMTSFNNLALMLDEALKQMQQQSSCSKPGQGNCEKPGGSGNKPKPSAGQLKKMQEALSKQLDDLRKQGKNKGENKGQDGQMSKQLAEMSAKQAAIRKMMEDKASELNEDGSGNGNELKQIARDMEQLQKDIVNNQINEETIRRQQDILIRLLKAENAELVREQDNQRKSNEAIDSPLSNPAKYADYIRRKDRETELLRTVPPNLKPYYRDKVNAYFNRIGAQP